MEQSILTSTKKPLGLDASYSPFDPDIITYINATFGVVQQLGVGPVDGFSIEDEAATWDQLGLPANQLNMLRTYVVLKVRLLFDPPTLSFHIEALNNQIKELEVRLRDAAEPVPTPAPEVNHDGW